MSRPAGVLERRLATVHPVLRSVPRPLRHHVWTRMAVSESHRYLYIRIPKAANSTIMRTLAEHTFPGAAGEIGADPTGRAAKHMFQPPSLFRCLSTRCLEDRYFIFSFFRDPFTRLLSAYLDKLQSGVNYEKYQWVADALDLAGTARDVSFPCFIRFLEQGGLRADVHWAPQTEICPIPTDRLAFRGRVEELEPDLERVVARVFGGVPFRGIRTHRRNRQNAGDRLDHFYTPELRDRVRALYDRDFRELAYD